MNIENDVISELEAAETARIASAGAAYAALIRELAVNMRPGADRVAAVLAAAGKTTTELKAAVAARKHRLALGELVIAGEKAELERPELARKFADAKRKYDIAVEQFHRAIAPINERVNSIDDLQRRGADARQELELGCPDEAANAAVDALRAKISVLHARRQRFEQREIPILRGKLPELAEGATVPGKLGRAVVAWTAEEKEAAERVKAAEKTLADTISELEELQTVQLPAAERKLMVV